MYKWLSQKDYEWCIQAEQEWVVRLPKIIERSKVVREQWREEIEHKRRWVELSI